MPQRTPPESPGFDEIGFSCSLHFELGHGGKEKNKCMTALKTTVTTAPAREFVSILIDGNARTGKIRKGGRETGRQVLGASGRDALNENGKLLIHSRRQQSSSAENFFCAYNGICISDIAADG